MQSQTQTQPLGVGYNFLATLTEAVCDDSDCEKFKEVDECPAPLDEPEGLQLHQTGDPSHNSSIPLAASISLAQSATSETGGTIIPKEQVQCGKIERY